MKSLYVRWGSYLYTTGISLDTLLVNQIRETTFTTTNEPITIFPEDFLSDTLHSKLIALIPNYA